MPVKRIAELKHSEIKRLRPPIIRARRLFQDYSNSMEWTTKAIREDPEVYAHYMRLIGKSPTDQLSVFGDELNEAIRKRIKDASSIHSFASMEQTACWYSDENDIDILGTPHNWIDVTPEMRDSIHEIRELNKRWKAWQEAFEKAEKKLKKAEPLKEVEVGGKRFMKVMSADGEADVVGKDLHQAELKLAGVDVGETKVGSTTWVKTGLGVFTKEDSDLLEQVYELVGKMHTVD